MNPGVGIPVITVNAPEYHVASEPDHAVVGRLIDAEIKKQLLGRHIALRGLGSIEHPGKSQDELGGIIKRLGTDRYDSARKGDRYKNNEQKNIDFFALPFHVAADTEMFGQLSWPFYHWGIKSRGFPIRVDILIAYDVDQLEVVPHTYEGRTDIKEDGFVFKDPAQKQKAIVAIFKIV